MRIGILSDTHGLLRQEVREILAGCDFILHAGDIDKEDVFKELKEIAPVYAVRGNADKEWAGSLPVSLSLELSGKRFFMIHNRKHIEDDPERKKQADAADFIVYGHSHKYEEKRIGDKWYLNPGSCGKRRFSLPVTVMIVIIGEDGSVTIQKKELSAEKTVPSAEGPADLEKLVRAVVYEMERGRRIDQIAERLGADRDVVEQICRMYATHPGIDADGIINRVVGIGMQK